MNKNSNILQIKKTPPVRGYLEWNNIYFIGIGGIGMSALARYFVTNNKQVAGYDKTPSKITAELENLGVYIHFNDAISSLPNVYLDKKNTLIVYTTAIKNHTELRYFKKHDFTVFKRSEILGFITQNTFCLAVAGTHGKTTTTSILGHIMQPEKATSFLGGIAENYNSNFILGGNKISVVEADEFDRSFLQLSPNIACITSVDADHLDVYGDHKTLLTSFTNFANKVEDILIVAKGVPLKGLVYAIDEDADYFAFNVRVQKRKYIFNVKTPQDVIYDVELHLPGKHNVMNALAALAMANLYGVTLKNIKKRLQTFKGIQRRFSYKINTENLILIDDYAHHPTEINEIENSIREMYPKEKILAVFQPHLFSRTQNFGNDFAKILSKFDKVLLLDIYPARELPIEGINSAWLLEKIDNHKKKLTNKENLVDDIKKSVEKIIVMMGAGDIGLLVNTVKIALENKVK